MYARVNSNSQLEYFTRTFIKHGGMTYSNPSEEIMNAEGWYLVPAIEDGKMATSWEVVDGVLVPALADAVSEEEESETSEEQTSSDSDYTKISKLKLVVILKKKGLYDKFFKWLVENDLREEWEMAQDLKTNNDMFKVAVQSLQTALGVGETETNDIINNSIMDED